MKQLGAFAAIIVCLVMPALAIVLDQDDWTVVTMAPDGSWGSATEPSVGQALAKAIAYCKAMSSKEIGCGAQFRAIQAGWVLATRCGDTNIVVAERRLADAERAAGEREADLRQHYAPNLPPCRRVLAVNPHGAVTSWDEAGTAPTAKEYGQGKGPNRTGSRAPDWRSGDSLPR